jgi:predicted ATPase
VQLFVERGRAVMPAFALDAGNGAVIGEKCAGSTDLARDRDGGRPASDPVAGEIARHLDDRFALLEITAVGRPTRHRTMEAAIDASHVLLSERDRQVFQRLAVFVGPFDLEAAGAVGLTELPTRARSSPP